MRTDVENVRRATLSVVAFCAIAFAWVFAMPPASGPDEPAHVYRAASLWRGQFLPTEQWTDGAWLVRVPEETARLSQSVECLKFRPEVAAGCMDMTGPGSSSDRLVTVTSGAGRYVPLYYYVIGWPSMLDDGRAMYWGMRLTSASVCIALTAWSIGLLGKVLHRRFVALAVLLAVTPQAMWLMAMVNPNSWEIAAGLLVWSAGLAYIRKPSDASTTAGSPRAALVVGCTVMLVTRRLGPLWLGLILVCLVLTWHCLPQGSRRPRPRVTRAGILVSCWLTVLAVASVAWHSLLDLGPALSALTPDPQLAGMSAAERAVASLPHVPRWVWQTYGVMGWLDTRSPAPAMGAWLLVVLAVALAALVVGRRQRVGLLFAVGGLGAFAFPVVVEALAGATTGSHVWQGRYGMPLTQGLVVAALMLASTPEPTGLRLRVNARTVSAVTTLLAIAASLTFSTALHRYTDGFSHGWDLVDPAWSPPLGVLALNGLAWSGMALLVIGLLRPPGDGGRDLATSAASGTPARHLASHGAGR